MSDNASFLGTGWSFPPRFDRMRGEVEMVTGETDIRQSMEIILGTAMGERIMQPGFGCNLKEFLFDEIDAAFITRMEEMVGDALLLGEPRILVERVAVEESEPGLVLINIDYFIRETNTRSNLVWPFYVNEATDVNPI